MAKGFAAQFKKKQESKETAPKNTQAAPEREPSLPIELTDQRDLAVIQRDATPIMQVIRVRVDEVYAEEQVRPEEDFDPEFIEELVASTKSDDHELGILSPPRCYPKDKRGYRLWFGENRWRSVKAKGEEWLDILVGPPPKNDQQRILGQLIENMKRRNLTSVATAAQFANLRDKFGMTIKQIADSVGMPKGISQVSKLLRLHDGPDSIKQLVKEQVTTDLELIYNLNQLHDKDPERAELLVAQARDKGVISRQRVKSELSDVAPKKGDKKKAKAGGDSTHPNDVGNSPAPAPGSTAADPKIAVSTKSASVRLQVNVRVDDMDGMLILDDVPPAGYVFVQTKAGRLEVEITDVVLTGVQESQ